MNRENWREITDRMEEKMQSEQNKRERELERNERDQT